MAVATPWCSAVSGCAAVSAGLCRALERACLWGSLFCLCLDEPRPRDRTLILPGPAPPVSPLAPSTSICPRAPTLLG
eukprot:10777866-Alexandrium_andersonii.AAC.1